jgi:hypothetical protein
MKNVVTSLKTELITQINILATVVLVWITTQPNAPTDKVLEYLPANYHSLAAVVFPILWGIVVQFAIHRLKTRTAAATEEKVVGELLSNS